MLEMRPDCECCGRALTPDSPAAFICSLECTFCGDCSGEKLHYICPNCGGGLVRRPARASRLLARFPATSERIVKPGGRA